VSVPDQLLDQIRVRRGSWVVKSGGAAPTRARRPLRIETSSTDWDRPSATARAEHQSRYARSSSRSSNART